MKSKETITNIYINNEMTLSLTIKICEYNNCKFYDDHHEYMDTGDL